MKKMKHSVLACISALVLAFCQAIPAVADTESDFSVDTWLYLASMNDKSTRISVCEALPNAVTLSAVLLYNGRITEEEFDSIVLPLKNGEAMPEEAKEMFIGLLSDPDIALETIITLFRPAFYHVENNPIGFPYEADGGPQREAWCDFMHWYQRIINERDYVYIFNTGYYYYQTINTKYWESPDEQESESMDSAYETEFTLPVTLCGTGDLNGSGDADLADAVMLARALGGTEELSVDARLEADLNGDTAVDQTDFTLLLRKLAGL